MKKVTNEIDQIFAEVGRAVRTIHGRIDDDIEQEAVVRTLMAFRKIGHIHHPGALTWKIVRDTVADYWRSERRVRAGRVEELPERAVATRPAIEEAIDRSRRLARARAAIHQLSCDIRGPVYLFYVEGYSIPTIARLYGKSISAVKMALYRGRQRLEAICRNQ